MSMLLLDNILLEPLVTDERRAAELRLDVHDALLLFVSGGVAEDEVHVFEGL